MAHEVDVQLRPDLFDHARQLVTKSDRPRQWFRPVAFQDVEVRSAYSARVDADQSGLLRHRGARHPIHDRRPAGSFEADYGYVIG